MAQFQDHFSSHAAHYRAARPLYPKTLFDALAALTPDHQLAWDAGCGNGQASVALTEYFARVHASDPSAEQIGNAQPHPRLHYQVAPAERSNLRDASVDLVTVAQALHWFDVPRFHAQVHRVLKPGGVIAEWCYAHCSALPAVDAVCATLYSGTLAAYWPPERAHVETGYAALEFPFARLSIPELHMCASWNLTQYLAYLESWSAVQRFRRERNSDPLAALTDDFAGAWGDPRQIREVRWLLSVRVGRRLR